MNCKGVALTQSDYRVLLETLRERVTDHWDDDKAYVRIELARFFNMVERDMPRYVHVHTAFTVARSLIVLGEPLRALDRIELIIFDVVARRTPS
ncbi:hypothetical protein DID96_13555 [Burkholderia sp. Bp8963]|nr:hypothetical protein DID96_13555 [Burkholderia sp. Bp8963]